MRLSKRFWRPPTPCGSAGVGNRARPWSRRSCDRDEKTWVCGRINAVAESFFATIKKELAHCVVFSSRSQAYRELLAFIDSYYNIKRRHSANRFLSPMQFEHSHQHSIAA